MQQHQLIALFILSMFLFAGAVQAAMITVNTTDDELISDGDCSLREAIVSANTNIAEDGCTAGEAAPTVDEIVFDASLDGTPITLMVGGADENAAATGDLDITESLTITGNGILVADTTGFDAATDANTVIDATGLGDRAFDISVNDGTNEVLLQRLAVTGSDITDSYGAAIHASGTALVFTLRDAVIANNQAANESSFALGGGMSIANDATRIINSLFMDNVAQSNTQDAVGGAIGLFANANSLQIQDSAFYRNEAQSGTRAFGGVISAGGSALNFTVENSVFDANRAVDTTDSGCTVADDSARGGAFSLGTDVTMDIRSSSFVNNVAETECRVALGGAIYMSSPVAGGIIQNSTFTGNATVVNTTVAADSFSEGGALGLAGSDHSVTLNNVTVTQNQVNGNGSTHGGGLFAIDLDTGDTATPFFAATNTLVAGNSDNGTNDGDDSPDCAAAIQSGGYTLLGNNNGFGCVFTQATGDQVGDVDGGGTAIDPMLAAAADNGGGPSVDGLAIAMLTHLPEQGSPALEAGDPNAPADGGSCVAADQRGIARPQDSDNDGAAACDIGAVEVAAANSSGGGGGGGGAFIYLSLLLGVSGFARVRRAIGCN